MNHKPLFLAVTLAALLSVAGVFWYLKQHSGEVASQPVSSRDVLADAATTTTETEDDSLAGYSPQHITPIPGSSQVWYEIPEMGIKLLFSKEVAEEIFYNYQRVHDKINSDNLERVNFFSKKVMEFNMMIGQSKTWDRLYIIQKFPGSYDNEPLPYGLKFLGQFDGFYLTDGGSPQALLYSEQEQRMFEETVAPALPKFPSLTDIHIENL